MLIQYDSLSNRLFIDMKGMVIVNRIDLKKKYRAIDCDCIWDVLVYMKKGYESFKTGYYRAYLKELFAPILINKQSH